MVGSVTDNGLAVILGDLVAAGSFLFCLTENIQGHYLVINAINRITSAQAAIKESK